MSTELDRISELAKEEGKRQFYSIAHMITFGALYAAFRGLRKKASAGVDGVHVRGIRTGRRGEHPSSPREAQEWQVSGATFAQDLYPQGKREAETNLDSCPGGQDRAEGHGRNTECHR